MFEIEPELWDGTSRTTKVEEPQRGARLKIKSWGHLVSCLFYEIKILLPVIQGYNEADETAWGEGVCTGLRTLISQTGVSKTPS